jgi:hypothetical protein
MILDHLDRRQDSPLAVQSLPLLLHGSLDLLLRGLIKLVN